MFQQLLETILFSFCLLEPKEEGQRFCVYLKPCRESGELLFSGFILSKEIIFHQPWKCLPSKLKRGKNKSQQEDSGKKKEFS